MAHIVSKRLDLKRHFWFKHIRGWLGRKNWLFAGSDVGAKRAAVLYSLVASCKLCDINPFFYLRDVLDRINTHPAKRINELVPHQWKELYSPKVTVPNLKTKPTS